MKIEIIYVKKRNDLVIVDGSGNVITVADWPDWGDGGLPREITAAICHAFGRKSEDDEE